MIVFNATRAQELYMQELTALTSIGAEVEARGRKTLEIINAASVISDPWHHCILLPDRRWNPWLALSEFLWIASGRNDVAQIEPYNSNIVNFSDDGETLYGAYGPRIFHQIDTLIERLRRDPSDRRAVLSIWESTDLDARTKDPPCNNMLYFKLRAGYLSMTVINRSNDIHWGLFAVNIPTFGLIQEYIASRLNVRMGPQTHMSNSLHVYTDDEKACQITDRMLADGHFEPYPQHRMAFEPGELEGLNSHEEFSEFCDLAFQGTHMLNQPFQNFCADFLTMYRERDWQPTELNPEFVDWITAGQLFADRSKRFKRGE